MPAGYFAGQSFCYNIIENRKDMGQQGRWNRKRSLARPCLRKEKKRQVKDRQGKRAREKGK